jgi:hypothetical protein
MREMRMYLSWNANVKDASSSTASTTTSLSIALMRDCTRDALFALYRNLSTNSCNGKKEYKNEEVRKRKNRKEKKCLDFEQTEVAEERTRFISSRTIQKNLCTFLFIPHIRNISSSYLHVLHFDHL